MTTDWQTTCINALRFGIAELQKPRVIEPIYQPDLTPAEIERLERWSERFTQRICDGELDT